MISLLIFVIITIGLTAGIGYGIFSLIKSGEVSLGIQKTQTLMLQISNMAGSRVQTDGARLLIPANIVDGAVTNNIPSYIPLRTTAYNKKITYCPVSPIGTAGAYTTATLNGRDFISEGAPAGLSTELITSIRNAGVVAYLLAPAPNTERDMACNEVSLGNQGSFNLLVNGGFATPIFADANSNGNAPWKMNFDVNSDEDLTDALNSIAYNKPEDSTINLNTDVNLTTNEISNITNNLDGRGVTFINNDGTSNITFTGTSAPILITGDVKFENIVLRGDLPLLNVKENGRLEIIKSDVGPIKNEMGTTYIGDNSFIFGTSAYSPIEVLGGTVNITQTASVVPVSAPIFKINGGTLYTNGQPNIVITSGSAITDFASQTVSTSGNGQIKGSIEEVSFAITGGSQPSITVAPLETIVNTCSGPFSANNQCAASCQIYGTSAKVVTGGCDIPIGPYSLRNFGINETTQSFFCQLNGDTDLGSNVQVTATCSY